MSGTLLFVSNIISMQLVLRQEVDATDLNARVNETQ